MVLNVVEIAAFLRLIAIISLLFFNIFLCYNLLFFNSRNFCNSFSLREVYFFFVLTKALNGLVII